MTGRPINTNQISSWLDRLLRKHGLYKEDVNYKLNKIMDKIKSLYKTTPDWVKTGLWIAGSEALASLLAYLLKVPELKQYSGVINFILFAVKELKKK